MGFFSECVKPHLKVAVTYCIPLSGVAFLSLAVPVPSLDAADVIGRWNAMFVFLWMGAGVSIFPMWRIYVALGQGLVHSRAMRVIFAVVGWYLNFWAVGFLLRRWGSPDYLKDLGRLSMDSIGGWPAYLRMTELLLAASAGLILYAVLAPALLCGLGRLRRPRTDALDLV